MGNLNVMQSELTRLKGFVKKACPFKEQRVGVRRQIVSEPKSQTFSDPAGAVLPTWFP
jgi:hypothetical protein